ncbi:gastrokine-1-like isoform X2 [Tiliqua scincoides]
MKFWVILPVSLGVFLTLSSGSNAVDGSSQKPGDSNTHQTVSVNQQDHVALIRSYNGRVGWDAVWNYKTGLFATRLFHKRVCVVATMDLEAFPNLEALHNFKEQKPASAQLAKGTPPAQAVSFLIGKTRVQNVAQFGYPIEHLCRGLPSYYASQEQGKNLQVLSSSCTNAGIHRFAAIYLCGHIPSC